MEVGQILQLFVAICVFFFSFGGGGVIPLQSVNGFNTGAVILSFIHSHCTSQKPKGEDKEVSVLDVGGKPSRIIPAENPHSLVGTRNPIHIVAAVGFEQGSQRWKARQDTCTQTCDQG